MLVPATQAWAVTRNAPTGRSSYFQDRRPSRASETASFKSDSDLFKLVCVVTFSLALGCVSGSDSEADGHGGASGGRAAAGSFTSQLSQLRSRHSVLTEEVAIAAEEVRALRLDVLTLEREEAEKTSSFVTQRKVQVEAVLREVMASCQLVLGALANQTAWLAKSEEDTELLRQEWSTIMEALPDQWRNVTEWAALAAEANTSATLAAASLRDVEQERVDAEADLAQKLETQATLEANATWYMEHGKAWADQVSLARDTVSTMTAKQAQASAESLVAQERLVSVRTQLITAASLLSNTTAAVKRWRVAVAEAQSEVAAAATEAAQEAARASEARLTAQRSASKAAEAERLAAELVLKAARERRAAAEAAAILAQSRVQAAVLARATAASNLTLLQLAANKTRVQVAVGGLQLQTGYTMVAAAQAGSQALQKAVVLHHMQGNTSLAEAGVVDQRVETIRIGMAINDAAHNLSMVLEVQRANYSAALAVEKDALARTRAAGRLAGEERLALAAAALAHATEQTLQAERLKHQEELQQHELAVRSEGAIRFELDTVDVALRKLAAHARAETEKWLAALTLALGSLGEGARVALSEHLHQIVGGVVACALGVYAAREAVALIRFEVQRRLALPKLVRQTSKKSVLGDLWERVTSVFRCRRDEGISAIDEGFRDVVLEPRLATTLRALAVSSKNAKKNGAPLRHAMFYGPPGTGKTMVAQRLALHCGLDFAVMSGGDVAPLGAAAVSEMHKLFEWATRTRRGLVLFIDEAEAFLGVRSGGGGAVSEHRRNVLSALLYHVGTQSDHYMLVIATNRPEDLDRAVVDRIDEALHFDLPQPEARRLILGQYLRQNVFVHVDAVEDSSFVAQLRRLLCACRRVATHKPTPINLGPDLKGATADTLAEMLLPSTQGFSGRELSKLTLTVQAMAFGAEDATLTKAMVQRAAVVCLDRHRKAMGAADFYGGRRTVAPAASRGGVASASGPKLELQPQAEPQAVPDE